MLFQQLLRVCNLYFYKNIVHVWKYIGCSRSLINVSFSSKDYLFTLTMAILTESGHQTVVYIYSFRQFIAFELLIFLFYYGLSALSFAWNLVFLLLHMYVNQNNHNHYLETNGHSQVRRLCWYLTIIYNIRYMANSDKPFECTLFIKCVMH